MSEESDRGPSERSEGTVGEPYGADAGGDPVCWLGRVCVVCGAFRDDAEQACPRCAAAPQEASGGV